MNLKIKFFKVKSRMHLKKRSVILLLFVVITPSFLFINSVNACNDDKIPFAEWKISNGQPYLHIEANDYYELGLLEGENLAFQIAWMKLMIMIQAQELGMSYDMAKYMALEYLDYIPENYILEMNGIADAIDVVPLVFMGNYYEVSIDFLDVLAQNCFWDIYYGIILPTITGYPQLPFIVGGCTAIGSHTGKKTIFGQTIDITYMMTPATAWVYTNIRGRKVFSFRMGSMLAFGGVNKYGLTLSVNLLEVVNYGCYGIPLSIIYRSVLEKARFVTAALRIIRNNNFTLGWNYIVRQKRVMLAIETIPNSYTVEIIRRGCYTFDANIYENPYFKMFMIYPTKYIERYNRVSELCELYNQDGNLDLDDLFEIYSDTLISRRFTTVDPLDVGTAGSFFINEKNNIYFCLGNPLNSNLGIISSFS
jgi:hypothetical protein